MQVHRLNPIQIVNYCGLFHGFGNGLINGSITGGFRGGILFGIYEIFRKCLYQTQVDNGQIILTNQQPLITSSSLHQRQYTLPILPKD
eukprot:UN01106